MNLDLKSAKFSTLNRVSELASRVSLGIPKSIFLPLPGNLESDMLCASLEEHSVRLPILNVKPIT